MVVVVRGVVGLDCGMEGPLGIIYMTLGSRSTHVYKEQHNESEQEAWDLNGTDALEPL